jgi:ribose-phosphate pyrophosphokinase
LEESIFDELPFYHIIWNFENEAEFKHLAQLSDLLASRSYATISLLTITYLPYGRQDKEINNENTFALRTFCKLLNQLGFSRIFIEDPHSDVAMRLIDNSSAIYFKNRIRDCYNTVKADMVCYPDEGALVKYSKLLFFSIHLWE